MKIDRNNYEHILIDYFDGRLSPIETACLMMFLEENPDLREDFEQFECIKLEGEPRCSFHDKAQLNRHIVPEGTLITEANYLQFFFDDAEDTLDANSKSALQSFLQKNPSLHREYYSWRNAHLIPETIVFEDKASLRRTIVVPLYRRVGAWASVAAVLALIFVAGVLISQFNKEATPPALSSQPYHNLLHNTRPAVPNQNHYNNSDFRNDNDNVLAEDHNNPKKSNHGTAPAFKREFITTMPAIGQLAQIKSSTQALPAGIYDQQSEYTGIMELIAQRQQLQQQQDPDHNASLTLNDNGDNYHGNGAQNNSSQNSRLNFWDIAELGVTGYNALSKKDVNFLHRTDAKGRTSGLALGSFVYERK